jgi:hypothetical protein
MTEAVVGLIGILGGILLNRIFDRLNRKDKVNTLEKKIEVSEEERCLLCYGLAACLDGLTQLGANHTVPVAREKLDKYLNKKAHGMED